MRNYRAMGALALAVGLLVVPGPRASAHHDDLRVFADVSQVFYADGGAPGYGAGDTRTVLSDLRNGEGKARGWSQWVCTVTRYDNGGQDFEADCDANFSLRDGDVSAIGRLTDEDLADDVVLWTIDGGTGHYDGARGTVNIRVLSHHGRMHGHEVAAPEEPPGPGGPPPGVGNDKEKPDKPDEPKPDEPKPDEPKPDKPKPDKPEPDEPEPDEPDIDEPDTDEPDTDKPDTGGPGTDEPDTDKPDTGGPGTDEPDTDKPDTGGPGTDEPDTDEPDTGGPGTDEPDTDKPDTGGPGTDEPDTDEPGDDEGHGGDRDWDGDRDRDGKRDRDGGWDRDWDRGHDHRCHSHGDRGGHCHRHDRDHDHDWDKDHDHDRTEESDYEVGFDFEN